MGTSRLRVVGTGLFFVFIFLSGYWLSRSGKPYNGVVFNVHKLIGLAMGVFLIVTVRQVHQLTPLGSAEIAAIVVTVLFFAGIVISGGLVSVDNPIPVVVSMMHKFLPYVAVLSTAVTLYLLGRK
jgi:hypothetical protein